MKASSSSPISVLLVEDNPDHQKLAERALREAGCLVVAAADGEEALANLSGADLVLLDYKLPRMSGIEVLAEIRQRRGPPVVVVTGMGSEDVAADALRGGAIDYIVKGPDYVSRLPTAVRRAWRTHDLARRAAELERMTLLLTSASDTSEIFPEIARGARSLLRADSCWVFVSGESGLELAGVDRDGRSDATVAAQEVRELLSGDESALEGKQPTDRLLVPLHGREDRPLGVMVVMTDSLRQYLPEEIRLARTFASFAGIAVANLTRFELERSLVAQLQNMLDMRTRLVGSVSHELRTPLTSIVGFSETLVNLWFSLSDKDRLEFIDKISEHSKELIDLVEGLLDFSTVEAGQMKAECEPLDLPAFLRSTLDSLDPLLQGRAIELETEPAMALGDPALIRRILSNLLSNAVKYSPPRSAITVRTHRVDDRCRIEVVDHGPGLTREEAVRAFEPFWRKEDWDVRGAGIGLSLVREYSRLMKGDSGVDSEPGNGSTFFFALPLADRSPASTASRRTGTS